MKTLASVLSSAVPASSIPRNIAEAEVRWLNYDSRKVRPGSIFFAFPGAHHDGRQFADAAVAAGAIAVVSELPAPTTTSYPWIQVPHGRQALALCAAEFYRESLNAARLIGITGTNGKTTVSLLVDAVLRNTFAEPTALIGTVRYQIANETLPAPNTTPESVDILEMVDRLVRQGGRFLSMEVSSHALALGRVYGIPYEVGAFTNLTQDHLDMHGEMENYYAAKSLLFSGQRGTVPKVAVLNADDSWANTTPLSGETRAIRFGMNETADLRAVQLECGLDGLRFGVEWQGKRLPLHSPLIGEFNAYNLLTAYGICLGLGLTREQIHAGLEKAPAVPGRFERVDQGQPFAVVIDYAHTPDALSNVLRASRRLRPERIITVFGCGGDRDRSKRPRMAEAAAASSDIVIVTSDNPRSEDPMRIIEDALVGLRPFEVRYEVQPDREQAIRDAVGLARKGDIVLIAGKGHENYQIFADRTIHFDDREVAVQALAELGYSSPRRAK
jgi:UDP-N-acetylmuramoyl-L-alanyl-D-glutamate--2,6-diaminopimelate ligase